MLGKTAIIGRPHTHRGFTRWTVLGVLVVVGLLALAVGPRLFGGVTLQEIATAKVQVATLGKALDQFHQDTGRFPSDDEGLDALIEQPLGEANWKGPYIKEELLTDPWGIAYQYHYPPTQAQTSFDLFSFGKDRTLGGVGINKDITYGDH